MRVIPVAHGLDDVLGVSTGDRSPGLHASTIYNDLYQELEPNRYQKSTPFDMARMDLGLTIEDMIEEGWKRRHQSERPGEFMTPEGIAFSPDGITFDPDGRTILTELKVTWMSCRECPISQSQADQTKAFLGGKELKLTVTWDGVSSVAFPPKFEKYFTQMKFYTHNLGLQWARLVTLFINGDYQPPRPVVLAWDFCFTTQELRENHQMMLNHARHKRML